MENEKIIIDFTTKEEHETIERHLLNPGIYPGKIVGFKKINKKKWKSDEKELNILIEVLIKDKKIPYFMKPTITAYGPSTLYKVLEITNCLESAKKAHENGELISIDDIINFLEVQLTGYDGNFVVRTVDGEVNYSTVKEIVKVNQ